MKPPVPMAVIAYKYRLKVSTSTDFLSYAEKNMKALSSAGWNMYLQTSPIRLETSEYSAYSSIAKLEDQTMISFSPSVKKNLNRLDIVNSLSKSLCP